MKTCFRLHAIKGILRICILGITSKSCSFFIQCYQRLQSLKPGEKGIPRPWPWVNSGCWLFCYKSNCLLSPLEVFSLEYTYRSIQLLLFHHVFSFAYYIKLNNVLPPYSERYCSYFSEIISPRCKILLISFNKADIKLDSKSCQKFAKTKWTMDQSKNK